MNYVASVIAVAATITIPLLFIAFVFGVRKLKFFLPDILVGIIVTYFSQIILTALLINALNVFLPSVMSTALGQQVAYVVCPTLTFVIGYWVVFVLGYKRQLSEGQVSRIAVGTTLTKILGDTLSAALSNLAVAQYMDAGTLDDYLAQMTSSMSELNVDALFAAYQSYSVPQFMIPAILTLLAVQTTYLFLILLGEHKPLWQQVLLVAAYSFFYYYTYSFPTPIAVIIGAMALLIVELYMISVLMKAQIRRVKLERKQAGFPKE